MKRRNQSLIPFTLLVFVSLACSVFGSPAVTQIPTPQTEIPATEAAIPTDTRAYPTFPPPPPRDQVSAPSFADYPAVFVTIPERFEAGYTLPVDLAAVEGMDLVELNPDQLALLSQNGFVVVPSPPGSYRDFYQAYEFQRYTEQPVFVTTDAVYHIYHLIFDKMLRDLENDYLIPGIEILTSTLLATTLDQLEALRGTPLEEPALRNVAYFAVAAQLLGLPDEIPASVRDLVQAEVDLIQAHSSPQISPIWDLPEHSEEEKLIEDYSQYVPRGHYTRSEAMQRYFRAMMWYGRLTFRLREPFETRRALLIVQALRSATTPDGSQAAILWENIYDPTAFIVGKADDLTYYEYGALSDHVFGLNPDPRDFGDEIKLVQFRETTQELPPPQVNSMWVWINEDKTLATHGFRFMGQRFTLDQYVFDELTWREVGTETNPRGLPRGLDFFAALGSPEAGAILEAEGATQYENYQPQMEKLRAEISALEQDSWTQNLYWAWIYALQAFISPKGEGFPAFMQTQAWAHKDLNTALSSWTQLKHDTLLYAKQVMAEMGGGGPDEPPKGYVEPNPEAFARLLSLAQMTYSGLERRFLLNDQTRANLENLINLLQFLLRVSQQQLAGQPLVEDDYWRIQYFGGELEALTLAATDCAEAQDDGFCRDLSDWKSPLVADVATGIGPDGSLSALEQAVGQPALIYVVLPDPPYRVAVGAVFTHYEFIVPVTERMTDETWQAQVESGAAPPLASWTEIYAAP